MSDNLRPHVSTWSKRFYNTAIWTKKLDDNYRTIKFSPNKAKKIKQNKNAFKGKTYLIVNESNSSATFILAEICKKNNYATLVGTQTGGTKKGITAGQIFFLTLPISKIEVDISQKIFSEPINSFRTCLFIILYIYRKSIFCTQLCYRAIYYFW